MSKWRIGSKGTQSPRVVGTAPKKTPSSYESHPGVATFKGTGPSARPGKGIRRSGLGAKNRDLRAKM